MTTQAECLIAMRQISLIMMKIFSAKLRMKRGELKRQSRHFEKMKSWQDESAYGNRWGSSQIWSVNVRPLKLTCAPRSNSFLRMVNISSSSVFNCFGEWMNMILSTYVLFLNIQTKHYLQQGKIFQDQFCLFDLSLHVLQLAIPTKALTQTPKLHQLHLMQQVMWV